MTKDFKAKKVTSITAQPEVKKTKEEIQDERFWNTCPTRGETYHMIKAVITEQVDQVTMASTLAVTILREMLVSKGICTTEEIEQASKDLIQKVANASAIATEEKAKSGVKDHSNCDCCEHEVQETQEETK